MSERFCVNGCQSTRTLDDGTAKRVPRLAQVGLVCEQCHSRLAGWLSAAGIPDAYMRLWMVATPGSVDAEPGSKHGRRANPPTPVRVDVLDYVDARLGWRSDGTTDRRGALGLVESWARLVREERRMTAPRSVATLPGECAFLHKQVDWICGRAWVDEFYGEIRSLARDLDAAIGYPWPQPIGTCPVDGCGESLWMPPFGGTTIRCGQCGAQWTRDRWLLLADVIEDEVDHGAGGSAAGHHTGRRVEAG